MATTTDREISLENIGPITKLSIPLPSDGGVVVLTGGQGAGKSTALRAISAASGGKSDALSVRDGQRIGRVDVCGARLSVSKARTSRSGELEVESIEGRFDLGKLIDPQIQDIERADAARIKQMLALTGAIASLEPYRDMFGDEFVDSLELDSETDDPIELHRRFVAACHSRARSYEKSADTYRRDVDQIEQEHVGLNVVDPPSVESCRHAERECVREHDATVQRAKIAATQAEARATAEAIVRGLREQVTGDPVEQAKLLESTIADLNAELTAAAKEFEQLTARMGQIRDAIKEDMTNLARVRNFAQSLASAEASLAACSVVEPPTAAELQMAAEAVAKAAHATETAVLANDGAKKLAEARESNKRAEQFAEEAEASRDIAKQAEEILATYLPPGGLRVDGRRLVCSTDRSNCEPYADLSHGERAIVAINAAAKYIPRDGIAVIAQEIWGGISESNRVEIDRLAKELGITILTAEVTDSPLGAAVLA